MAVRDVLSALAPRQQVMPAVPAPFSGFGFQPPPTFGMGFTQVAGADEDLLGLGGINSPDTGSVADQPDFEPLQIRPLIEQGFEGAGRQAQALRPVREPGEQRMLDYRQSVKTPAAVRDASGNVYTGWSHEDALASMPSAARAGEVEFGFLPPAGRFVGVWEAEDRGLAGVFPKGP